MQKYLGISNTSKIETYKAIAGKQIFRILDKMEKSLKKKAEGWKSWRNLQRKEESQKNDKGTSGTEILQESWKY